MRAGVPPRFPERANLPRVPVAGFPKCCNGLGTIAVDRRGSLPPRCAATPGARARRTISALLSPRERISAPIRCVAARCVAAHGTGVEFAAFAKTSQHDDRLGCHAILATIPISAAMQDVQP